MLGATFISAVIGSRLPGSRHDLSVSKPEIPGAGAHRRRGRHRGDGHGIASGKIARGAQDDLPRRRQGDDRRRSPGDGAETRLKPAHHAVVSSCECRGAQGAVIAIGNFDGVHLGHRAVIAEARRIADGLGAPLAILTFEPHPRCGLRAERAAVPPDAVPRQDAADRGGGRRFAVHLALRPRLRREIRRGIRRRPAGGEARRETYRGRRRISPSAAAVPAIPRCCMTWARRSVSALRAPARRRFRRQACLGEPHPRPPRQGPAARRGGTAGPRLGDRRPGRARRQARARTRLSHRESADRGLSPSRAGRLRGACRHRGRDGALRWHDGVANFGNRPTFDGQDWRLETNLFDFSGDLYGKHLRVALVDFIRPDMKFTGADELVAAMHEDAKKAPGDFETILIPSADRRPIE